MDILTEWVSVGTSMSGIQIINRARAIILFSQLFVSLRDRMDRRTQ